MTEVLENAVLIREHLLNIAQELKYDGPEMDAELRAIDAETCYKAVKMLEKLGMEVTRLRAAIGHFKYGRISRLDLVRMPDTWNDDGRERGGP